MSFIQISTFDIRHLLEISNKFLPSLKYIMSAIYLVLHGYYQSADIIRKKLKSIIPKNIELIIPDAPLNMNDDKYAWFPLNKIDLINGNITIDDDDISAILTHNLGTHLDRFDGVIAFSQGCLTASILLGAGRIHTSKLLLFSPIPIPKQTPYDKVEPNPWKYTIPTGIKCKVYLGSEDTLVAPRYSLEFISALGENNIEITEHRWGHVIPSTQYYRLEYNSFFGWI